MWGGTMTIVDGNFWNFFEGLKFSPDVCEERDDSGICIGENRWKFCPFWCDWFVSFKEASEIWGFDREAFIVHNFDTDIFTRIVRGCEETRAIIGINSSIIRHRCRADSVSVLWKRIIEPYHCHFQYSSTFHSAEKFINQDVICFSDIGADEDFWSSVFLDEMESESVPHDTTELFIYFWLPDTADVVGFKCWEGVHILVNSKG